MIPTLLTYLGMLLESGAAPGNATVSAIKLAAALASRTAAGSPGAVGKA